MTPPDEAERCKRCDREECGYQRERVALLADPDRDLDICPSMIADLECRANAINWRARCLRAEQAPVLPADVAALLAEWRKLFELVTPGKWTYSRDDYTDFVARNPSDRGLQGVIARTRSVFSYDAKFIAAARTGWPRAVEIIEALLKERK